MYFNGNTEIKTWLTYLVWNTRISTVYRQNIILTFHLSMYIMLPNNSYDHLAAYNPTNFRTPLLLLFLEKALKKKKFKILL